MSFQKYLIPFSIFFSYHTFISFGKSSKNYPHMSNYLNTKIQRDDHTRPRDLFVRDDTVIDPIEHSAS